MSKSTYKKAMHKLRQRPKPRVMVDDLKHSPFIPSKDVKVEYKTAKFGNPKRKDR